MASPPRRRQPRAGRERYPLQHGAWRRTRVRPTCQPRELEICETIGPELKKRGLLFVGIDVIDGNLTEINVTSPTGLRAIKKIGGPDLAVAIWDAIEARRAGQAAARKPRCLQASSGERIIPSCQPLPPPSVERRARRLARHRARRARGSTVRELLDELAALRGRARRRRRGVPARCDRASPRARWIDGPRRGAQGAGGRRDRDGPAPRR